MLEQHSAKMVHGVTSLHAEAPGCRAQSCCTPLHIVTAIDTAQSCCALWVCIHHQVLKQHWRMTAQVDLLLHHNCWSNEQRWYLVSLHYMLERRLTNMVWADLVIDDAPGIRHHLIVLPGKGVAAGPWCAKAVAAKSHIWPVGLQQLLLDVKSCQCRQCTAQRMTWWDKALISNCHMTSRFSPIYGADAVAAQFRAPPLRLQQLLLDVNSCQRSQCIATRGDKPLSWAIYATPTLNSLTVPKQ